MIYLGQYYNKTGLYIPKFIDHSAEDDVIFSIELENNVDNNSITQYVSLEDSSDNEFYYEFEDLDTSSLSEGEYTLKFYVNNILEYTGLMSFRDSSVTSRSVFDSSTQYIVFE